MARDFFIDTITYVDAEGDAHPTSNVEVTVKKPDDSVAQIYVDRTSGTAHANPFVTDANAEVSFWANAGEFKIELVDLDFPQRFADKTIWWMALPHTDVFAQVPVGTIVMTGRDTAPTGWLICDGDAISRTAYDDLYDVIGTKFGIGDASSTFNLPDLRGRVPVGKGDHINVESIGLMDAIALASRTPYHAHPIPHTHSLSGHTHPMPHTHAMPHTHNLSGHTHLVADHSHSIPTEAAHSHTFDGGYTIASRQTNTTNAPGAPTGTDNYLQTLYLVGFNTGGSSNTAPMDSTASHNHGGNTGGATPGTGGPDVNATGDVSTPSTSGVSTPNTSAPSTDTTGAVSTANSSLQTPPFQVVNFMIKH